MKNTKRTQSGRSMIEMVGVLAVMGLITAGAFVLITSGMQSQKRSRVADEIAAITSEMQNVSITKLPTKPLDGVSTVEALNLPTSSSYGSYTVWRDAEAKDNFYVGIVMTDHKDDCSALSKRAWSGNPIETAKCADVGGSYVLQIKYAKESSVQSTASDKCAGCSSKCTTTCEKNGCCTTGGGISVDQGTGSRP